MRDLGLVLVILLCNVLAYLIFQIFVTGAPPELVIFFTFVSLLIFQLIEYTNFDNPYGSDQVLKRWKPKLAFEVLDQNMLFHVGIWGTGLFAYNCFFWFGYTSISENTAFVLAILALNICVPYIQKLTFESHIPTASPIVLIFCLLIIAFSSILFTLNTGLERLWEELISFDFTSLFQGATLYICAALIFDIIQEVEHSRFRSKFSNYSLFENHIDVEEDRESAYWNIVIYLATLFGFVLSAFLFARWGLNNDWTGAQIEAENNKLSLQNFVGYAVMTIVFVSFGVLVKLKIYAKLRASDSLSELLFVTMAMRPVVFYLVFPITAFLVHNFIVFSAFIAKECAYYGSRTIDIFSLASLEVTNNFQDIHFSDGVGVFVLLIAGSILYVSLAKRGGIVPGWMIPSPESYSKLARYKLFCESKGLNYTDKLVKFIDDECDEKSDS